MATRWACPRRCRGGCTPCAAASARSSDPGSCPTRSCSGCPRSEKGNTNDKEACVNHGITGKRSIMKSNPAILSMNNQNIRNETTECERVNKTDLHEVLIELALSLGEAAGDDVLGLARQ